MKATRRLIPAFAMLLIAAVMMSTATFAWFSTNSTVTATGMTVTAKADTTFIVIGTASTLSDDSYQTTEIAAVNTTGTLYPAKYSSITDAGVITWQKGVGKSIIDATINDKGYKNVETSELSSYVLKNTFYIRVATGFESATNLKLSSVNIGSTEFNKAVSVVVNVTGTNKVNTYRYNNESSSIELVNSTVLADTLSATQEITVDVYVYIDGDNKQVTTTNVGNLSALTAEVVFSVGE